MSRLAITPLPAATSADRWIRRLAGMTVAGLAGGIGYSQMRDRGRPGGVVSGAWRAALQVVASSRS